MNATAIEALGRIGTLDQAEAVLTARSLGDAVLLMERHYGGVSEEDFAESRQRLRHLEDGCRLMASQRPSSGGLEDFLEHLKSTQALASDLPMRRQPVSLVDFLLNRPDWSHVSRGSCFPIAVLAAHLGAIMEVHFQFVLQTDHINLFHPPSACVLDLTGDAPHRTSIEEVTKTGDFGEKQMPGPPAAAVATGFLNLAIKTAETEDQARSFLDVALAVYPEFPMALTARAVVEGDPAEQERLLLRALDLYPRFAKALEHLWRLYDGQRRFDEFKEVYRQWRAAKDPSGV